MASHDHALPAVASNRSLDAAGAWFWRFLKNELSPYPGRFWVVARMTIAAAIVMVIVMTFRIPYGFLGAIYTLLLSRENPTVTFRSGVRTVISYALATVYTFLPHPHCSRLHHRRRLRLYDRRRDSALG
jgi:multidrug resistance protein MdtO